MRFSNTTAIAALIFLFGLGANAIAFEGRIQALSTVGGEAMPLQYTVGTNLLRVEVTATNWPNPINIFDVKSGALILLFPHNRSFARLNPATETVVASSVPSLPSAPGAPPGIDPQFSSTLASGIPAPPMRILPSRKLELQATGQSTNLLGFACARFEMKERGETVEIWATEKLFPFQPYQRQQLQRFGPRGIDEQWPELLKARKLFPLLVSVRNESGREYARFEVKSITPGKITDSDGKLFQPPSDYQEIPVPSY
ncbi:MAG: hypothetical protein JWM68_3642 [Verrucomicrobiales bacterium]|nr:hypothetical protein [Verrucomicrobiales bacterium]